MAVILFKTFSPKSLEPGPGELYVCPAGTEYRGKLAQLALDQGPSAFVQGEGPLNTIIVGADPTLDEMLACRILELQLAGETLPDGMRAFARYSGILGEGLRGSSLSLDLSLEGIYLALRHQSGDLLKDSSCRESFLAEWRKLAASIEKAAREGQDPIDSRFLAEDPEWARVRAYLARDQEVYQKQDLPRAERWMVNIPDCPEPVPGIVLRQPRSFLWKYWFREDPHAPGGKGYPFLAVYEVPGHWRFSTDPLLRLSIASLAAELQKKESARDPQSSQKDPWYDGRRHQGTLVGAPWAGTQLTDAEVLQEVRRWGQARPVRKTPHPLLRARNLVAAVVLLTALPFLGFFVSNHPTLRRGLGLPPLEPEPVAPLIQGKGKDYALLIATNNYTGGWTRLENPEKDATDLKIVLEEKYGFEVKLVKDPTLQELVDALDQTMIDPANPEQPREYHPDDQLFIFIAGHGDYHPGTGQGLLVARDSDYYKDKSKLSYLKFADLKERMERHPCKHIFLVLDVCFGGTIDFRNSIAWGEKDRGLRRGKLEDIRRRSMEIKTRRYFTSANKEAAFDGKKGENSPFAAQLLKALEKGPSQGGVTLDDLWMEVRLLDPEPRRGDFLGNDQMSDFFFLVKK